MISPFCLVLKCGFNHSKIKVFNYLFCAWWWYFFVCLRSKKIYLVLPIAESVGHDILVGFFVVCFTVILLSCSKFHSTEYNNEDFNCLKYFILGYFFLCRRCSIKYVYLQLNMIHVHVWKMLRNDSKFLSFEVHELGIVIVNFPW